MTQDRLPRKAIDRPIGEALRSGTTAAADQCPAPDVLAAYFDRSLSSAETRTWEAHFAACLRCQRQLAAIARSDVAAGTASGRPVRSWLTDWRLLGTAAAATAAIAWWIAVQPPAERPAGPAQQLSSDAKEVASSPNVEVAQRKAAEEQRSGDRAAPAPLGQLARTRTVREKSETRVTPERDRHGAPEGGRERAALNKTQETQDVAAESRFEAGAPVASRPTEAPAIPAPSPPAAAAAPAPAASPATRSAAEEITIARGQAALADRVDARSLQSPRRIVDIVAPGKMVRWRIGPRGAINRSRDGGQSWEPQTTGATADLIAGAAVSPSVCWVVGRSGTILRTIDGDRWETIHPPADSDLIAVEVRDALSATVTTFDGRRHRTHNGGQTWQKR